jgi:hypothetical protein
MTPLQTFTKPEMEAAIAEWGCNCGPAALAVAAQVSLDKARRAIPGFDRLKFTNPTAMRTALETLKVKYTKAPSLTPADLTYDGLSIVRIQFAGPWDKKGANPRWGYQHTHWIATWQNIQDEQLVAFAFDINGGFRPFRSWHDAVLPQLIANDKRRDGGWRPTHVWRVGA